MKCNGINCKIPVKDRCGEYSKNQFVCTLKRGHKGQHAACGVHDHNYHIWDQAKKQFDKRLLLMA